MTIQTSILYQVIYNSKSYFHCVHHRLVPGKCFKRHCHTDTGPNWNPGTDTKDTYRTHSGKDSCVWMSFVPGTHFYIQKTKYTQPVPTTIKNPSGKNRTLLANDVVSTIFCTGRLGSLTAANWVSLDFNVSYSSCWGYSLINTLKLKITGPTSIFVLARFFWDHGRCGFWHGPVMVSNLLKHSKVLVEENLRAPRTLDPPTWKPRV